MANLQHFCGRIGRFWGSKSEVSEVFDYKFIVSEEVYLLPTYSHSFGNYCKNFNYILLFFCMTIYSNACEKKICNAVIRERARQSHRLRFLVLRKTIMVRWELQSISFVLVRARVSWGWNTFLWSKQLYIDNEFEKIFYEKWEFLEIP